MTATTMPVRENPLVEALERLPVPDTTADDLRRDRRPGTTASCCRRFTTWPTTASLPEHFNVIGVARREESDEKFRDFAREAILEFSRRLPDAQVLDGLLSRLRYLPFSFDDAEGYVGLREMIDDLDDEAGRPSNRIYYLSTAPEYFRSDHPGAGLAGLNHHEHCDVRVIIEKPFGYGPRLARDRCNGRCRACSASARCSASTTTWARRPSRT